jgi:Tol biopolymer transport system component
MKKALLLFALLGQVLFAQQVNVQSITFLKNSESGGFYYPTFSPSGDYLLMTSENYTGLKQYSFTDKSLKTITTDAGAGYGVQMSADGNTILYKKTDFVNRLRQNSLISYSRTTGKQSLLVSPTREPITAKFSANKPQFVKGKALTARNITKAEVAQVICIEDQKMVLYNGANRIVLTPNGESASYIWPAISPNKKNIAYTVASKGTFVCRIDGTNPVSLGKLNAPAWLNNQWLVGMDDKDDGEKLLSSSLIAISINGKIRQTIATPKDKMAMYPAASADGTRIAFNTDKGEIYLLNIQIK